MALLGAFIDSRTLTVVNSNANITYAHGLPANPDVVHVEQIVSTASTTNWIGFIPLHDATNVTIHNIGAANSQNFRAVAVLFHSIVR